MHVGLEPVVDDDLPWADDGRALRRCPLPDVVEDPTPVAVLDALRLRVGVVDERERLAAMRVLDDVVGQVHGVDAPAVVAAGQAERIAAPMVGILLVSRQRLVSLDEPVVVDVELGAAGEGGVRHLVLGVPAEGVVGLIGLDG